MLVEPVHMKGSLVVHINHAARVLSVPNLYRFHISGAIRFWMLTVVMDPRQRRLFHAFIVMLQMHTFQVVQFAAKSVHVGWSDHIGGS